MSEVNNAKKVTEYDVEGKLVKTFDSINQVVQQLGIPYKDLKTVLESGDPWKEFTFKFEEAAASSPAVAASPAGDEEEQTEKVFHLTKADIAELLGGVETKLREEFKKELAENRAPAPLNLDQFASSMAKAIRPDERYLARMEEEVDHDDFLQQPVKMFTYNHYFSIFGEMRYGHEVKTPYGRPIRFKNVVTQKGGKQVLYVAEAMIQTKKELEWMRKSPMFGIIFHEKIAGNMSENDRLMASKLSQAFLEVAGMSEYQIMQRAKDEGVPASSDIEVLRVGVIRKIAEKNMAFERGISREAAVSEGISSDFDTKNIENAAKRGTPHSGVRMETY